MSSVSVVICNFNYAQYIERTILSVLNQTCAPKEIIVVDDGSFDESRLVLSKYESEVKLILKENQGQCSCYNVGLEVAKGEFVLFLDSDDTLLPTAIEEIQKEIANDIVKIQFRLRLIDRFDIEIGSPVPRIHGKIDPISMMRIGLEYPSPPASGNVYRTSMARKLLPLPTDEIDKVGADFFLIFASPYFGKILSLPMILGEYRVHSTTDAISFGNSKATQEYRDRRVLNWRHWLQPHVDEKLPPSLTSFASLKIEYARICCESSFVTRIPLAAKEYGKLLVVVFYSPQYSFAEKIMLYTWVLFLPFLPSNLRNWASRKVCNPAER